MRFKVEENLPIDVADLLGSAGHDALTVFDQGLIGEDDSSILGICKKEQRNINNAGFRFQRRALISAARVFWSGRAAIAPAG